MDMKVYNLTAKHYPMFKQNNSHIFGCDDEISKARRDYIRTWHENQYMPYQSIYEKESRKSEFELKRLISSLEQKPVNIDNKKLNELNLFNLDVVDSSIYRGAMLSDNKLDKVEKLYEVGIRRIIPVGSLTSRLQEECERIGIECLPIVFNSEQAAFETIDWVKYVALTHTQIRGYSEKDAKEYVEDEVRSWEKKSRYFITLFINYIQGLQKGNVYMGCNHGTWHTDTALMFDYLFNPKMKHDVQIGHYNKNSVRDAENLYRNLTSIDKAKLGWSKDFEQVFLKRLKELKSLAKRY